MNSERIERLKILMEKFQIEVLALNPGPTLYYLTGHSFHLMERPVLLFIPIKGNNLIVLPELEAVRLEASKFDTQVYSYDENPSSQSEAIQSARSSLPEGPLRIALEPLRLRYFELNLMQQVSESWDFYSGEEALAELRMLKEPDEVSKMETAVDIAESALQETLTQVQIGMTEREVASLLTINLLDSGSDSKLPFEPIVASGPNSALPHATPTNRKLKKGDLLLLDWGARHEGYISDITRTFAIGNVEDELKDIYTVVAQANEVARKSVSPSMTCGEIDHIARNIIDTSKYGDFFIHRTGHGIGLETHEPPYIRADNERVLKTGMTFTVEPGIYIPEKGGVRIEDDMLVTETHGRSLSHLPRELMVIA